MYPLNSLSLAYSLIQDVVFRLMWLKWCTVWLDVVSFRSTLPSRLNYRTWRQILPLFSLLSLVLQMSRYGLIVSFHSWSGKWHYIYNHWISSCCICFLLYFLCLFSHSLLGLYSWSVAFSPVALPLYVFFSDFMICRGPDLGQSRPQFVFWLDAVIFKSKDKLYVYKK